MTVRNEVEAEVKLNSIYAHRAINVSDKPTKSNSKESTIGDTKKNITENQFLLLTLGGLLLISGVASVLLGFLSTRKPYAHGIGVLVFSMLLYCYPPFRRGRLRFYQWFVLSVIMSVLATAISLLLRWILPSWFD